MVDTQTFREILKLKKLSLVLIALGFCAPPLFAQDAALKAQWEAECRQEYDHDPGYRQASSQEKDQQDCKGKVGESFCLDEKKEDYFSTCLKKKENQHKSKEIKVKIQTPEADESDLN